MSPLFFIFVLVGLLACAAAQDCSRGVTDGCSIPFDLPFFYKNKFQQACDKHDICYGCGAAHGITKQICDIRMYRNAMAVCHSAKRFIFSFDVDVSVKNFCGSIAKAYYHAVDIFGHGSYRHSPESYCQSSWVQYCL